jgi:hypothetical protein
MAKRGPKLKKGKRFPSGELVRRAETVSPTAEFIAKRVARFVIAGVKPDGEGKVDLRLASSWLGVLYAANIITRQQFDAGQHYHHLYRLNYPQGYPQSCLDPDLPTIGGTTFQAFADGSIAEGPDLALKTANKVLTAISRKGFNLVVNICAFDRLERFIDTSSPRPIEAWEADAKNKTIFLSMLDALVEAFGFHAKQKIAA